MDTCSEVFEVVEGKDYSYCENKATVFIAGNPFCIIHANAGNIPVP